MRVLVAQFVLCNEASERCPSTSSMPADRAGQEGCALQHALPPARRGSACSAAREAMKWCASQQLAGLSGVWVWRKGRPRWRRVMLRVGRRALRDALHPVDVFETRFGAARDRHCVQGAEISGFRAVTSPPLVQKCF